MVAVMAAIYRKEGTKNLYCTFTASDGKKVHRSTGKQKRSDAMKVALELEELEKAQKATKSEIQHRVYGLLKKGAEYATKGKLTHSRARDIVSEMMEVQGDRGIEYYTMRQYCDLWLEGKQNSTAESTFLRYKSSVNAFLDFIGKEADSNIEFIQGKQLQKFQSFLAKTRKNKTTNHYLKDIGQILRKAHKNGLIRYNPYGDITPLPPTDSIVKKPFSHEEVNKLLEAANNEWEGIILLGCWMAMRLSDAANLKWANIDLNLGEIDYLPNKTKKSMRRVRVPMAKPLHEYLKTLGREANMDGVVFKSEFGKTSSTLSKHFTHKIMDSAGVDPEWVDSGKGRRQSLKSFHSTRHTCNSWLANAGVSSEIREAIVGHSDSEMNKRYTHLEMGVLKNAISKIE